MDVKNMLIPGIVLGVVVGILGAVPFVNLCNICCLWIVAGGFVAAYLYGRDTTVELVDGAVVGVIYGFTYGIVVSVTEFLVTTLLRILRIGGGDLVGGINLLSLEIGEPLRSLILTFFNILLGMVFGAVGGVISSATMEGKGKDRGKPKPRRLRGLT
jgi:hypothetical protein